MTNFTVQNDTGVAPKRICHRSLRIDIHNTAPGAGDIDTIKLRWMFVDAKNDVFERIDSLFRGSRIATGKHVAKVRRKLGLKDAA